MSERLPNTLPIFPLPRVVLLPRVMMPLNIFEPRYLAMCDHALGNGRMIGIIQKKEDGDIYQTGCAGRIVSYEETDDGRYLVTLKGISRFNIAKELPIDSAGFRKVTPDWAPYVDDLSLDTSADVCREAIMQQLRGYFDKMNMFCDQWESMRDIPCEKLVSTLSVVCPFDATGKQALLEAQTLEQRIRILQALLEEAVKNQGEKPCCH